MNDDFRILQEEIDKFIEQGDHSTLMILSSAVDLVVPAKLLEAVGRQSEHIVLLAVHAFESSQQWLNELMSLLQNQVDAANGERAAENMEPWPALPLECMNPHLNPKQRLKAAADYCASLLPEDERILWVFLPHQCDDISQYQQMISSLCGNEAWLDPHRFFVWEDKADRALLDILIQRQNEDVLVIDIDFSTNKLLDNLVATVENPEKPEADRIEALYQLAAVDFSYKRYDMAYEKYKGLFNYFEGKDKSRQALCLLGCGDIATQLGDPGKALTYYQSGIALAIEEDSLPVLLPLLIAAGSANMALTHFPDAEGYFENANLIAAKLMNPYVKADMLEKRGLAQVEQNKGKQAIESWQACAGLSAKFKYQERWNSALNHLAALYQRIGDGANLSNINRRLKQGMEADEPTPDPAAREVTV